MDEQGVCRWLTAEGYEPRGRQELSTVSNMATANLCASFEHPAFGWVHFSRYDRASGPRFELVMFPRLLGERTIHNDLDSALTRLDEIKRRFAAAPAKIWSEPKRKAPKAVRV